MSACGWRAGGRLGTCGGEGGARESAGVQAGAEVVCKRERYGGGDEGRRGAEAEAGAGAEAEAEAEAGAEAGEVVFKDRDGAALLRTLQGDRGGWSQCCY
jgi:hypothetical protein